jgi:formiminotetrahydrofolate cyclodeaminase
MIGNHAVFYQRPFDELIDLACSKSHVPGGGSIAAMTAVLGASMSAMVANLSLNKKGSEHIASEMEDHLLKLKKEIGRAHV